MVFVSGESDGRGQGSEEVVRAFSEVLEGWGEASEEIFLFGLGLLWEIYILVLRVLFRVIGTAGFTGFVLGLFVVFALGFRFGLRFVPF